MGSLGWDGEEGLVGRGTKSNDVRALQHAGWRVADDDDAIRGLVGLSTRGGGRRESSV